MKGVEIKLTSKQIEKLATLDRKPDGYVIIGQPWPVFAPEDKTPGTCRFKRLDGVWARLFVCLSSVLLWAARLTNAALDTE